MKVLVANLANGELSGGYQKYLKKIIPLLCVNGNVNHVDVFVPPQTTNPRKHGENCWISWPEKDHEIGFPWLKTRIKEIAPDVVFIPTARWLECGQIPVVTMIRNMEPLIVPFGGNPWKEVVKNIGRAYVAKRACKKATRVIAVSKHVKDFLHNQWNIESSKIGTVYHGAEAPNTLETLSIPDCLQNQKSDQYVFTSGSIRLARGLEDIIHALGILRGMGLFYKLVIAGGVDPGMDKYRRSLEKTAMKLGVETQIIWAGRLTEYEMAWCYQNSSAFVMTSRAEACPNIVLEAMAHGCVCVSTETLPMPEFFNDSAIYYPPKNAKALAKMIETVLELDDNQRNAMSEKAKKRAAEFSWGVCAEKTVGELAKAVESRQSGEL